MNRDRGEKKKSGQEAENGRETGKDLEIQKRRRGDKWARKNAEEVKSVSMSSSRNRKPGFPNALFSYMFSDECDPWRMMRDTIFFILL